jgi:hypothetical protein
VEKLKMNRDYETGEQNDVTFFTGYEVEKTPAYDMKTLFVVGVQSIDFIERFYQQEDCEHIFFGANHSFNPKEHQWNAWEKMIKHFLDKDIMCSLDLPLATADGVLETSLVEYHTFIPQFRVVVPHVKQWPYNTMIKIDDKDFKATNAGVWCHTLHDLTSHHYHTDWSKYKLDKVLK